MGPPHPDPAAAGAWVAGGVTQMDDQQHALSALLAYRSSLGEPPAGGAATGSEGTPPR